MDDRLDNERVTAPDFPPGATWLNTDHPLTMEELEGRIVLLDFWTYCCINCLHILPDLHILEEEFPQLVVIGVHSAKFENEQGTDQIRSAILRYGIEHPVIADNDFELWEQYGVRAWPTVALIGPTGKIQLQRSGEGVYQPIREQVLALTEKYTEELEFDRLHFSLERDRQPVGILAFPAKLAVDTQRDWLWVSDANHNRLLAVDQAGAIQAVVGTGESGTGNGTFAAAEFTKPQGLTYDAKRDRLYVADTDNHLLRYLDLAAGSVHTLAGNGEQARAVLPKTFMRNMALNSPWDVAVRNDTVFVAMAGSHQLWAFDPETGLGERYAGSGYENLTDGPLVEAALAQPSGLTVADDLLLFADSEASAIRQADHTRVTTWVGGGLFVFGHEDGDWEDARLQHPLGITFHKGKAYIADTYNHCIKVLDPAKRLCTTLIGTGERGYQDGPHREAQLFEPNDVVFWHGKLYFTDTNNHLIRMFDPQTGLVSTMAFTGLERMAPKAATQAFDVTAFEAAPVLGNLPTKATTLSIRLALPQQHHLNPEAPNYARLNGTTMKVAENGQEILLTGEIPAEAGDVLGLEAAIYYCREGAEAACLIKRLSYRVSLTGGEEDATELVIELMPLAQ